MAKYGMPYKGSKNKIAEKIISVLPEGQCFCDLFGGGGAVTDCALQSGKYKKAIYNEIEPLIYEAFQKAVNGDFKNESRWVSREDFLKLKDTDPYVAICFSFGNDLKAYCYSPSNEAYKKALHWCIVYRDYKPLYEYMHGILQEDDLKQLVEIEDKQARRKSYRSIVLENAKKRKLVEKRGSHFYLYPLNLIDKMQSLESLERLQSLKRLQSPESLESLEIYNLSYEQVKMPNSSIIYCDIPYRGTNGYKNSNFDYEKFYKWALNQDNLVFVSEYSMPEEFHVVAEWGKTSSLSQSNNTKTVEKLFCNKPYQI